MLNQSKLPTLFLLSALVTSVSGCVVYTGGGKNGNSVSGIMGNITIDPNSVQKDLSMVNGNIHVGHNSEVKSVNTVNGNIELESSVRMRRAETVNGDISAGERVYAEGDVTTVNGSINLGSHAVVQGNVSTVNGDISLEHALVEASLVSTNGDMALKGETLIKGDVVYRKHSSSWFGSVKEVPELVADSKVSIEGNVILERPVELKLAPGVLKGQVIEKFGNK